MTDCVVVAEGETGEEQPAVGKNAPSSAAGDASESKFGCGGESSGDSDSGDNSAVAPHDFAAEVEALWLRVGLVDSASVSTAHLSDLAARCRSFELGLQKLLTRMVSGSRQTGSMVRWCFAVWGECDIDV